MDAIHQLRGFRKTFLTFLALTYGFTLAMFEKLTPEFATIATVCVGAFHWANASSKGKIPPE